MNCYMLIMASCTDEGRDKKSFASLWFCINEIELNKMCLKNNSFWKLWKTTFKKDDVEEKPQEKPPPGKTIKIEDDCKRQNN